MVAVARLRGITSALTGRAGVGGLGLARSRARALSQTVRIVFVDTDGSEIPVDAPVGKSILEVAHANDIELEGACDGSLACSTCHVILDEASFKKLKSPGDEELDMLDLAFDLQKTSRLGCQVKASPELEGMRCQLPAGTNNMSP